MRVLFVEPPKEFWFILGEYLPPPLEILTLARYLETKEEDIGLEVEREAMMLLVTLHS